MSMEMPIRRVSISRLWSMLVAFALVMLVAACNTSKPAPPAEAGPKTFATPDDAGAALLAAVKQATTMRCLQSSVPVRRDLIFSGNDAEDKTHRRALHQRLSNHEPMAQTDRWQ